VKRMLIAELCAVAFLVLAVVGIVLPSFLRRTRAKQDLGEAARELQAAPSALIKQLGDPATRLAAARELGRLKDRQAAEFIPYCLTDEDPEVRRTCVWALGEIAEPKASPHIRWRLSDRDLRVRVAAAEALAKVPDAEGIKELVGLLRDPEPEMRGAVKQALLKIGAPALGDLDAAVEGAGMDVRPALVELVAAIGGPDTVQPLLKLLASTDAAAPRERRDSQANEAVRKAVVAALGAAGPPAAEALGQQLTSPRCSLEQKQAIAEAFKLLGTPAIEPVARHVLAWKIFPRQEELRLWTSVLEAIGKGDPRAVAALQRAREQLEAPSVISGTGVPPVVPRIMEVSFPTPYSPTESPPVPKGLPPTGQVKLWLRDALVRTGKDGKASSHALELNLLRLRGEWLPDFWGKGVGYNQGDHEGRIVRHEGAGGRTLLDLEVAVADDNWVPGGFGRFRVAPNEAGGGSYDGSFNGRAVKGEVGVEPQEWPEAAFAPWSIESGEHPRLLFHRRQLAAMRQRAQTELGRAIVAALRAKVAEDEQTLDHAIGWALLGLLLDDPAYSRQAIPVLRHGMKTFTIGHQHDSARKMLPVALAYDLAYPAMTEAEIKEFNDYVVKEGQALGRFGLGNNCLSANSNWCAISFGPAVMITLAGLREKGPFDLAPPKEQPPVAVIAPDPVGGASVPRDDGAPIAEFKDGELLRDWLVVGPVEPRGAETPRLQDAPREGAAIEWQGKTLKFARLPESAIHKTPPFLKLPGVIRFADAPAGSRFFLYCLLKIAKEQGAQIHIPVGEDASASLLINGRRFGDGDVVALQPGVHRLLLEVAGPAVSPFLTAADHGQRLGLWERYQWQKRRWEALKAQHEKTGEAPQVPLGLATSSRYVGLWFTHAIGEHAWKTEPEGYTMISLDMVLPAAACYPVVTGRPLVCGTGLPWALPLQLMRTTASGGGGYSGSDAPFSVRHLCYATHLSRPELQPALLWEFRRRLLTPLPLREGAGGGSEPGQKPHPHPALSLEGRGVRADGLAALSCQELAFALAFFPLDVKPRPPEEVMPKVIADRRKGAFLFRNHYTDCVGGASAPRESGDIVATMFYRSERPYGGTYFHPQAGSFRISGLGTAWANGIIGNKRQWDYADECVLHLEGSNGDGLGKVLYFECQPDGSGVVAADMSDVYNRNTKLGVTAERHFAVDYSGASGAPALFAIVDRVKGEGKKSWRLHTEGKLLSVSGSSFTIEGRTGGTLQGRFISPAGVHVVASGGTLSVITEAPEADFLVVMTIQKGAAPEIKAEGTELDAKVTIGGQAMRFENGKLVFSR